MSQTWIGSIAMIVLVAMIFLRVPVAASLIIAAVGGSLALDGFSRTVGIISNVPYQVGTEYTLSVVPLFILMGAIASRIGLSERLFRGVGSMFGRMPGSGAMATIGASAMFGAICGSSLATTATIGRIAIPEMRKAGYHDSMTSGAIAAGGTLGILIPPSIVLVIYGIITEQSVERLFAGAMIPGLVLTAFYLIVVQIILFFNRSQAPVADILPWKERFRHVFRMWEVVVLFGVSVGGIYAGIFTPTEAASVGVITALALGLARNALRFNEIKVSFVETMTSTSVLFFVVLGATMFAYFIIQTRIPFVLVEFVQALNFSPTAVMLIIILFYVIGGCFLDGIGLVLATVPVFFPLVKSIGYDPIWFGVLVVIVVEIGLIHPPVGMNLFVIKAQAPDMKLPDIYRGILPFLAAQFVLIATILMFPRVVLWLPQLIFK